VTITLAGALVGHGMLMAIIVVIVGIIFMLIMIPLQQIFLVGCGYQYKSVMRQGK
jgi:CBS-domain-containing membrane protein